VIGDPYVYLAIAAQIAIYGPDPGAMRRGLCARADQRRSNYLPSQKGESSRPVVQIAAIEE
jgi:hypothetical protein